MTTIGSREEGGDVTKDNGASSGPGSRASTEPQSSQGLGPLGFDSSRFACPECGTEFAISPEAVLPEATDLTFVIQVAEGQMIQAKTLAGVVKEFDNLQRAIGKEIGAKTTTLIKSLNTTENGTLEITFRICNSGGVEYPSDSDRSPKGGDRETGLRAKHESVVAKPIAQGEAP